MPLQKRRMGPARIHNRRSAWMRRAGKKPTTNKCPQCAAAKLPHRVCMKCGYYRDEVVIEIKQDDEEI